MSAHTFQLFNARLRGFSNEVGRWQELFLGCWPLFAGNLWILAKTYLTKAPVFPAMVVADLGEIPVGGVKLFSYPVPQDHCILVRTSEEEHVA